MPQAPATTRRSSKGWTSFSAFVVALCKDLGHIYNPKTKKWRESPQSGGVIESNVLLGIDDKTGAAEWALYDGNDDEFPWEFLQFPEPTRPKALAQANDTKFRKLLSRASVSLSRYSNGKGYMLDFFFMPVMFGNDNRDFMEFSVTVRTRSEDTLPRTEATHALKVAATHLQRFQKKTALGPPGGSSVSVGTIV